MKVFGLLLIIIILFACNKRGDTIPASQITTGSSQSAPPIYPQDSVSYLALGDSYTYGAGLTQNDSYPYQFAARLKSENYNAHDPIVIAFPGWTAGNLLSGIAAGNITKKFDFVTILIGVNDENKGTDLHTYALNLDQLLAEATSFTNGYSKRVFVISIPDWSVTPFAANMDKVAIKTRVDLFNSINEAESRKLGANYLDITALSELAANDPILTGSDGLHPTAKMYALWVNQIYSTIIASFN